MAGPIIQVSLMNFGTAVTGVSQCVCTALEGVGDPVCRCVLAYPSPMPWDYCDCDCPNGAGSGQLASWTGRPYASTSFPQPDTPQIRPMDHACGPPYLVTPVTVEVARCFPTIGQDGLPPAAADVIAATLRMHRDATVIRQAIGCCLRDLRTARTIERFFIGETVFTQPSGGCASVQVNYLIAVKHCICAG